MTLYKPGSIVRTADGREGTVVFNGLTGQGIAWGRIILPKPNEHVRSGAAAVGIGIDDLNKDNFNWPEAVAMIRESEVSDLLGMECVGVSVDLVAVPSADVLTADGNYHLIDMEGE